jgi:hypothetical protein
MDKARSILSDITVHSKYAKYLPSKQRRENWEEIVSRNYSMHFDKFKNNEEFTGLLAEAYSHVLSKQVLPSMRALEDATPIRTTNGWKSAGTVQVGDDLFASNGTTTRVKEVVKFKDKDLYRLIFGDGSYLEACDEHLWIVSTKDDRLAGKTRVVDTKFIREHLKQGDVANISIANPNPIEFTEKEFYVDPYILGHWLGDGYSSGYQISCSVEDSVYIYQEYEKAGYPCKKSLSTNIWTWSVKGLSKDLRKYNLLGNKHIPEEYQSGSITQRLSLLEGLMDSDGCITKEGRCIFSNTNAAIIDGVEELLSSLGIKYTTRECKPDVDHHLTMWEIRFTTTMKISRLPRKRDRIRSDTLKQTEHRKVVEVEYIGKGNATCFHVDSKDHSFLAGNQMIVTHNSLQFGGKPIELSPNRLFNCLAEETEFITNEGLKSFKDFKDGDSTVVLTHHGRWQKAKVRSYGKDNLNKITFHKGRSERVVYATENHRWINYDGEVTTDLQEKDILYPTQTERTNFDWDAAGPMERLYWCYGYVFGDGTVITNTTGKYSMVRLCGDDVKYLPRFKEMGFSSSEPNSCNGDIFVYTGKYQKTAPDLAKDHLRQIKAFMDGYLSADAYKNPDWYQNNSISKYKDIQSSDKEHIDFLKSALDLCGYYILNIKDLTGEVTNYGIRPETYKFSINNKIGSNRSTAWSVNKIEATDRYETVWCLEVENDQSFTLSGGIITGNCSYTVCDDLAVFSETMFLLLGGSGVGYSVQKHHVEKLPELMGTKKRTRRYLIGDSIEGWADAVKVLVEAYFLNKSDPIFDYRDIRQKGMPLITSGGKAPGSQPLKDCIHNLRKVMDAAINTRGSGTQLTPIEVHDMQCYIADAVLSGGIRRAALISLFSFDDQEMLECKFGNWWELNPQRARANNSAVALRNKIRKKSFFEFFERVKASNSGEPGIYFTNDKDYGSNPCCEIALKPNQFCVSGDTTLITKTGIETIETAVDKEIEIWNGKEWSKVKPYKTGDNDDLYRVQLSDGSYLDATANHKFLAKKQWEDEFKEYETLELINLLKEYGRSIQVPRSNISSCDGVKNHDAYEYGFFLGDGYIDGKQLYASLYNDDKKLPLICTKYDRKYYNWNGKEYEKIKFDTLDYEFGVKLKTRNSLEDIFAWDRESILRFMAGWIDADGSKANNGCRLYGKEEYIRDAQLLLTKVGINSSVNLTSKAGTETNLGIRKNDVWYLQIPNASEIPSQRLDLSKGKDAAAKGKYQIIKSITKLQGKHKSYCLTEDNLHQCVFNNILTKQCNLTTINVSDVKDQADLNDRARAAAIIGTVQASYTDFHYLRDVWKKTTEKDALIGVSMTGIASGRVLELDLTEAANIVKSTNQEVARIIGINPAARCTCVKPEGTASLVVGSSSGIHAWHAEWYIRRMRFNKAEPIHRYLKRNLSELLEDEILKPDLESVLSVPIAAPKGATFRTEPALELLERGKYVYENWVKPGHIDGQNTHNVSITVSVKDNEWTEVGVWMWENRKSYNGIAILPHNGGTYAQAPFEDCTEEKYNELFEKVKDVDLTRVKEEDDLTNHKDQVACAGGQCELQ